MSDDLRPFALIKSKWFPLEEAKKVVYPNIAYLLREV